MITLLPTHQIQSRMKISTKQLQRLILTPKYHTLIHRCIDPKMHRSKAISNSRLRHVTKINKQLRYVTGTPTICLRSRKVQQILCSILKNKFFKWDEMEALVQWLLVIPQKMSVTIASLQTQDSRRFGYWLAKEKMKLMWKQVRKQAGIINLFEIWLQLIYDFQFLHSNQIFVFHGALITNIFCNRSTYRAEQKSKFLHLGWFF